MLIALVFVCTFFAFSLSAVSGGGAGLLLVPMLGNLLPVTHVPASLSIGTFSSSASRIVVFFKNIRFDIVKWFVPAVIPATIAGACILKFVNPEYLQLVIALYLFSHIRFLFMKAEQEGNPKKYSNILIVVIGFLTGLFSALLGAVGIMFNRFYLKHGLTNQEIVATRAANELIAHVIKFVFYIQFGLISSSAILYGLVLASAALISTYVMKWILPRISIRIFKNVGYAVMVLSGMAMLVKLMVPTFI